MKKKILAIAVLNLMVSGLAFGQRNADFYRVLEESPVAIDGDFEDWDNLEEDATYISFSDFGYHITYSKQKSYGLIDEGYEGYFDDINDSILISFDERATNLLPKDIGIFISYRDSNGNFVTKKTYNRKTKKYEDKLVTESIFVEYKKQNNDMHFEVINTNTSLYSLRSAYGTYYGKDSIEISHKTPINIENLTPYITVITNTRDGRLIEKTINSLTGKAVDRPVDNSPTEPVDIKAYGYFDGELVDTGDGEPTATISVSVDVTFGGVLTGYEVNMNGENFTVNEIEGFESSPYGVGAQVSISNTGDLGMAAGESYGVAIGVEGASITGTQTVDGTSQKLSVGGTFPPTQATVLATRSTAIFDAAKFRGDVEAQKAAERAEVEAIERAARERAAREKAARDKAAREKAARDKAARDKAAREAAERDRNSGGWKHDSDNSHRSGNDRGRETDLGSGRSRDIDFGRDYHEGGSTDDGNDRDESGRVHE
ncbi:hypothetical protein AB6D70_17130 [Vibrio splendidus]